MGTSGPANGSPHVFLKNHLSVWGFHDLGVSYYPDFAAINGRGQLVTLQGMDLCARAEHHNAGPATYASAVTGN